MFLQIQRVVRIGSTDTELKPELIRADLIERMRPVELGGHDEPCTELVLGNEETVICQGTFRDIRDALADLY